MLTGHLKSAELILLADSKNALGGVAVKVVAFIGSANEVCEGAG